MTPATQSKLDPATIRTQLSLSQEKLSSLLKISTKTINRAEKQHLPLKDKILKLIVVVLVVSFFKRVMAVDVKSVTELLYLAVAILLISASGYLLRSIHES